MKFFMGLLSGSILTVLALAGTAAYLRSPSAQAARCMALYSPNFEELSKDESIQARMKEEGFANIEDMIRDRCELFVRNGQKF